MTLATGQIPLAMYSKRICTEMHIAHKDTPTDNCIEHSFVFLDATEPMEHNDHSNDGLHTCTVY